jgi:hypothetical protein
VSECDAAAQGAVVKGSLGVAFEELDGARHIYFVPADRRIRVTSDVSQSSSIEAAPDSVETGLRSFLSRFARDVDKRIPDAFDWKDLSELRSFV